MSLAMGHKSFRSLSRPGEDISLMENQGISLQKGVDRFRIAYARDGICLGIGRGIGRETGALVWYPYNLWWIDRDQTAIV